MSVDNDTLEGRRDRCWLCAKQAVNAAGAPRPLWRQRGAGLG